MRLYLVVLPLLIVTCFASVVHAADQCVSNETDLDNAPELHRILENFGGRENLEGKWRLSGALAHIHHAIVGFQNRKSSLWTTFNEDPAQQVTVCSTDRKDTFKVIVLQPVDPKNKIILISAVPGNPNKMKIIAHQTKGMAITFEKMF